mmetsp:Transcript_16295/g.35229  ORF Transcript_16295/g.35229 Transcript_16295/m.35229 type:complete len:87 (+) Transcript_16295:2210-2470(+)
MDTQAAAAADQICAGAVDYICVAAEQILEAVAYWIFVRQQLITVCGRSRQVGLTAVAVGSYNPMHLGAYCWGRSDGSVAYWVVAMV